MTDNIVASRMNLQEFKNKNIAAKKGFELLKKKCDALKTRFRIISKSLIETKKNLGVESNEAFFNMAKSELAAGEIKFIFKLNN